MHFTKLVRKELNLHNLNQIKAFLIETVETWFARSIDVAVFFVINVSN